MKTLALLLALTTAAHAAPPASFFRALHVVETNGKRGAIKGDAGRALGPLQIHRSYHADSRVGGSYSRCADLEYSKRVVAGYLQRHAPTAWKAGDVFTLARIHNGGVNGDKKPSTLNYAARVTRLSK